jgi:hypothetical protein
MNKLEKKFKKELKRKERRKSLTLFSRSKHHSNNKQVA